MILLQHLHPAAVHFPIALLLVGSVLALVQMYRPQSFDLDGDSVAALRVGVGRWSGCHFHGAAGSKQPAACAPYRGVLNWHIGAALAQLVVYGLLLYRGWLYGLAHRRKQRVAAGNDCPDLLADPGARGWVTATLVIGMLLVVATGWNGGVLVYEWGVNGSG